MDSGGSNGKEMLFQTGPNSGWLLDVIILRFYLNKHFVSSSLVNSYIYTLYKYYTYIFIQSHIVMMIKFDMTKFKQNVHS